MSLMINRIRRAIDDAPKGGMHTGTTMIELRIGDAQRVIAELQEIAGIKAQLAEVNNNRTGVSPCAKFCEALAAKKMFDNLQDENAELKAKLAEQVAQIERIKTEINAIINDSQGVAGYHLNGNVALWDEFDLLDILQETPDQCLAEVRAQAVMDFVSFVYSQFDNGEYHAVARIKYHALNSRAQGQTVSIHNDAEYCGIIGNAEAYAKQLRQQASK